jgi:hypothetical protein
MLILACTTVVLLAGFYTLLPLFRNSRGSLEAELLTETEMDRLLYQKAIIYSTLKDLEFEYKVGRLVYEDFQQLESGYKTEAAMVLQKLDRLGVGADADDAIEHDIAARKAELFAPGDSHKDAPSRCRSCGAKLISGKKFCADCGKPIGGTVSQ